MNKGKVYAKGQKKVKTIEKQLSNSLNDDKLEKKVLREKNVRRRRIQSSRDASPKQEKGNRKTTIAKKINVKEDSLYQALKKQEKLAKQKDKLVKEEQRNVLKATQNVIFSTPNTLEQHTKSQKTSNDQRMKLMFNVSPIKLNATVEDISKFNVTDPSADSLLVMRLKQIEEEKAYLESNLKNKAAESFQINIIPPPEDISEPAESSQILSNKRTVHFNQIAEEVNTDSGMRETVELKPGKWRKSLVAWRKSHNFPKKQSSRHFVALFPIKTDPGVIARYKERLQLSLENSALLEQSDEGHLQTALSILDSSFECENFVPQRKTSKRETSVFKKSSIFYGLRSPQLINVDILSSLSARQIVLRRCGQLEPLPFDDIYSESKLPNCKKIGEGVFGEVFMYTPFDEAPRVIKIIPIEGEQLVNGEPQKIFDEILSEIVISMELSNLRHGKQNVTDGFVNVKRVTCVKGSYPQHLLDEWEIYNDSSLKGSENDNPEIFGDDQLYIVFELCNAGLDVEAFQFKNAEESFSIFLQIAFTLAVAETKFEFEHRDLHWGNILVARTDEKFVEYRVNGKVIKLPTFGVKATIIDYTLSRMVYDGAVLYDNLAKDEELFNAHGDYQFDIYRLMRYRLDNDFKRFDPYTNLLWLHYLIDKLIDGARYKYSKSDKHKNSLNKMMQLRDELLVEYQSASEYVNSLKI